MKGWQLTEIKNVQETTINEPFDNLTSSKVKITKTLINSHDILRYTGEIQTENIVLGSYGIGVISEPGVNLFDLNKGSRVYINPKRYCENCYNCKSNNQTVCSNLQIAGEDYNGFLRDFVTAKNSDLHYLPDFISDDDALFIEYISLALAIIDKLDVQKGEHIAVIGANNLGNILSQLLIYYQAVPILIGANEEDLEIAKSSGIYYTLLKDENLVKEVSNITGGRMAKSVVYIANSEINTRVAFSLAGFNSLVAITGYFTKNNSVSIAGAIKKELVLKCINTGYGNIEASINLLANKAINLSKLKLNRINYEDVPATLEKMAEAYENEERITPTIVTMT